MRKSELTDIQPSFAEFLREFHTGRENAITSRNLRQWGSDVEIREMVHNLRVHGEPICSCRDGYYYAANSREVYETVQFLYNRVRSILRAYSGLEATYYEMRNSETSE